MLTWGQDHPRKLTTTRSVAERTCHQRETGTVLTARPGGARRGDPVLSLGRGRTRAHTCPNTVKVRVNQCGKFYLKLQRGSCGAEGSRWRTRHPLGHREDRNLLDAQKERRVDGRQAARTVNADGAQGRGARVPVKVCLHATRPRVPMTRRWKQHTAESAAYPLLAMALLGHSPHTLTRGRERGPRQATHTLEIPAHRKHTRRYGTTGCSLVRTLKSVLRLSLRSSHSRTLGVSLQSAFRTAVPFRDGCS